MRRANVHSAGRFQSAGSGMPQAPYSTEGYCRNARCAKTALITAPAKTIGHAIFQMRFMLPRRVAERRTPGAGLIHWTRRTPWMALG